MAVLALPLLAGSLATSAGVIAGSFAMAAITTAASFAGAVIDSAILGAIQGPIKNSITGPRLDTARIQTSIEGSPIPRCFGRNRISGQVFWSSRFKETEETTTTSSGGKGFGGGGQTTITTSYTYTVSLALGLCEGPIIKLGRIWADGKLLDLTGFTFRIYTGSETQEADPKIIAVEGVDFAPAHRGIAYIVFEEMPLAAFGNRIPQFNFEVFSFARTDQGELEYKIPGMNIIPGAGEYAYEPEFVASVSVTAGDETGLGWTDPSDPNAPTAQLENVHNPVGISDWELALDDLKAMVPNIQKTQLVVTWFGTDLRMQNCEIRPEVETYDKLFDDNQNWFASDITRAAADLVSMDALGPLVGGTPADIAVYNALQDLDARGHNVSFYPFIIMDIDSTNTLPDPYSNNAATVGQPAFPWRGRIVPSPAPGFTGSPDKTSAVSTHVTTFMGACVPGDFGTWDGLTIPYSGPAEKSYRRFILHYAKLCAAAGGVDTFYIGTEMVRSTEARSATSTYPFVAALKTLAAEVAVILPSTSISYAADWSEYHSHRPSDGSNDIHFNLDPLWSDSNITFVSIDNYMPLSDWRDNPGHLDSTIADFIYDLTYLKGNIEGGELYDYFYASDADRISQTRTVIDDTDPADEDWVFRQKDIKNWWLNAHHDRPGGTRSGSPTSWVVESKPIVFSELGSPAVNKGSNQPNVFVDPKSSESFFPYFSTGARDDYIQRVYIEAWIDYWAVSAGNNPTSAVYAAPMIDVDEITLWTWDARPYPYFPLRDDIWRDGDNWRLGHWLTGRLGQVTLPDLITRLTANLGLTIDVTNLSGLIMGYMLDRIMSSRDGIEPLALVYLFDSYESEGTIKFRHRGGRTDWTITEAELVPITQAGATYRLMRKPESELPDQSIIHFIEEASDYSQAVVQSKRLIGDSNRVASSTIGLVSDRAKMQGVNDILLIDSWLQREIVTCVLPPKMLAADPTDIVKLTLGGIQREYRIDEISFEYQRPVQLSRTDRGLYHSVSAPAVETPNNVPKVIVSAVIDFIDLPLVKDDDSFGPRLALFSEPWQANSVFRSPLASDFTLDRIVDVRSQIGVLTTAITAGPEETWDFGTEIIVQMISSGVLETKDEIAVLNGKNIGLIKADNGQWEVIQWVNAVLVSGSTYKLTKLLRGQLGTDDAMRAGADVNAQFVFLAGLVQSGAGIALRNIDQFWKYGPTSRPIDDFTYSTVVYAPKALGLRPYSPVQVVGINEANDDWTLTWVRRDRLPESADSWEGSNIPLSEEAELYEIDIWDVAGTTVLRTLTATIPTVTYTAANQVIDFGVEQTALDIEVYQMSTLFGRGTGRRATL